MVSNNILFLIIKNITTEEKNELHNSPSTFKNVMLLNKQLLYVIQTSSLESNIQILKAGLQH